MTSWDFPIVNGRDGLLVNINHGIFPVGGGGYLFNIIIVLTDGAAVCVPLIAAEAILAHFRRARVVLTLFTLTYVRKTP